MLLAGAALISITGSKSSGRTAILYIDGEEKAEIPLNQDRRIQVRGPLGLSVIEVADGRVRMLSSPCGRQICVRMGAISEGNALIVCVPNRILIRIPGDSPDRVDAITE